MLVTGVVQQMTTESAERAALGAGAIVLDAISADDGREDFERIERIRHLKPDIVLLTGGVDGGTKSHVVEIAEMLLAAAPKPRFGDTLQLPVIYAGNQDVADEVAGILESIAQISVVSNVRPTLEQENLAPAREAIHEFFLTHVMSHSPGYNKLLSWTPEPVMPTPAAVGDIVRTYAERHGLQVLCVDIGGATTDLFSVFRNDQGESVFNRTVSANLGMSYSVANVLVEAGTANIARWLAYPIADHEIRDRLRNKMIRPTSIPQTKEDLQLEQAVCREALRLSLDHHRSLAVGLSGVQQQRSIADIFAQKTSRYELVDMMKLDLVIGSGGVLSHAPNRIGAALMMLEGFGLQGVTEIAVDSIFMMPHLGVLASVHSAAADEIFVHDCLVKVCHAIVPVYPTNLTASELVRVQLGSQESVVLQRGELVHREFEPGKTLRLVIEPLSSKVDVGGGPGRVVEREIVTGQVGILLDGRNRPLQVSVVEDERRAERQRVYDQVGLFSESE